LQGLRGWSPAAIIPSVRWFVRLSFGAKLATILACTIVAITVTRRFDGARCVQLTSLDAVSVSIAGLARGTASFFCYRDSAGQQLRFLLARDDDGKVNGVFDACGQCYRYHQGYTVAGRYIVCRLCGNRYPLADVHKGLASCTPVKLPVKQHGEQVQVRVADLRKGRPLF
jgi:uncharacterized membrane protein